VTDVDPDDITRHVALLKKRAFQHGAVYQNQRHLRHMQQVLAHVKLRVENADADNCGYSYIFTFSFGFATKTSKALADGDPRIQGCFRSYAVHKNFFSL